MVHTKWVYRFGPQHSEGDASMRNILGGKGANLAEMSALGIPVPPGFTLTTEVCTAFYRQNRTYPAFLKEQVDEALYLIGEEVGAKLGAKDRPLLVSVRSGARASMPGMMDTVLNLGLNDETVEGLAARSGDRRFAYDSYRRFIQMYSDVVLDVGHDGFEEILDGYKDGKGYVLDTEMSAENWEDVIKLYKARVLEATGASFPQDVEEQLWGAIGAVFLSWHSPRAITYRKLHGIPEEWGTAVNVQAMVFGNMGETSATGVAFTRNPSTGTKELYGEFLVNAQGEDVVAGIRTPQYLTRRARLDAQVAALSLEELMPQAFSELEKIFDRLEKHYRDMQDLEFTIQDGKLWMLQTRNGKRTTRAALKIAVEMAREGLMSEEDAVLRIEPASLDQLLHPTLDPKAKREVIVQGLPASPGAAAGEIVFNSDDAEHAKAQGKRVILVRVETSPEDIHGMHAAQGILTTRGGMTSHAAVVARGMGKPCVCGASGLSINLKEQRIETAQGIVLKKGDFITIDGTKGQVMQGEVPMVKPELSEDFVTLMSWADRRRDLKVRANADTPQDAEIARSFGAEGIGLCRTEHMFFDADRILAVREMIVAENREGREAALAKLLPMQRSDFKELFKIMGDLPVTIRLLDPPLHEFLPKGTQEIQEFAKSTGISSAAAEARIADLHEFNPMLGHRGVRLAISYPEIAEMQARAIFEAAAQVFQETGNLPVIEVMIPLIATKAEFDLIAQRIFDISVAVEKETGLHLPYLCGTMVELPRACLQASEIAQSAQFFSFGTNDLTQTCLGLSRDDSAHFLGDYVAKGIFPDDPFVSLDKQGVGELVEIAVERGRRSRKDLKLGICGEHGGDPKSIDFFHRVGLHYVSCSPFRVPIARLAAAQSALLAERALASSAQHKLAQGQR